MGNFFRRSLAFILGMVFSLVVVLGGTAGVAYWAFKNFTLSKAGVMQEDTSGIGEFTVEEWVALVVSAQNDPEGFTIKKLQEQGIDIIQLASSMGLDLSKAESVDMDNIKDINPLLLFSAQGLDEISFSTVFALLPKNENGVYPLFSNGARQRLRNLSLGYLLGNDEATGKMRLFTELKGFKIGCLFPTTFTEMYDETIADYKYLSEQSALESFGNLPISLITDTAINGETFDIGKELNEGDLKSIGELELDNFINDLTGAQNQEGAQNPLIMLDGIKVKELFKLDEESGVYAFNLGILDGLLSLGKLMGYEKCIETEQCKIHTNGALCDGEWYVICTESSGCPVHDTDCEGKPNKYKLYDSDDVTGIITKNLISISVMDVLTGGGFDILTLTSGVYLGHSLGYKMATGLEAGLTIPTGYCLKDCNDAHEHNYYWLDENDVAVEELYLKLSNVALEEAVNGTIDLEGIVEDSTLGSLLGKHKVEGDWFNEDNTPVSAETAIDKIMLSIYDKTVDDLSGSLELSDLIKGVKLGELMSYKLEGGKWFDKSNVEVTDKLNLTLFDVEVEKLVNGDTDLKGVLKPLYVGDLMGYVKQSDGWYKNDAKVDELKQLFADVKLEEVFDGTFDINSEINGLTLGEVITIDDNTSHVVLQKLKYVEIGNIGSQINGIVNGLTLREVITIDDNTSHVVLQKLADKKIGDLESEIDGIINSVKLGDIIDTDAPDTPKILKLLEDSEIQNVSTEIKELQLGQIMGYTQSDGKWYNESGQVEGLNAKIADYTFNDFTTGVFDASEFTLGDVITGDTQFKDDGIFALLKVDTTGLTTEEQRIQARKNVFVKDVATSMEDGVTNATIGTLMNCGVVDNINDSQQNTLNKAFGGDGWKDLTVSTFIGKIVELLDLYLP